MATTIKYKAISSKFAKISGKLVPTMTKSDLSTKAQIKTWVNSAIETAASDGNMVSLQVLIRAVEVDE